MSFTHAMDRRGVEIVAEIARITNRNYGGWHVGITSDPERRRGEHGDPAAWHVWDAQYEGAAREIERHMLGLGMVGGEGGGDEPTYVYIWR